MDPPSQKGFTIMLLVLFIGALASSIVALNLTGQGNMYATSTSIILSGIGIVMIGGLMYKVKYGFHV
jgi:hypothetical protein